MITGHVTGTFEGTHAFVASLVTVENYISSLMQSWANVLVEDNRKGVLAGTDKDDKPVAATIYRNSFAQAGYDRPTYVKFVPNPFGGVNWQTNITGSQGPGYKPGSTHNLTTKQYKTLSGPPLAPRGMASRIISNYQTYAVSGEGGDFGVEGKWDDVVSKKNVSFLPFHFSGNVVASTSAPLFGVIGVGRGKNLARRDMAGLRAWGRARARTDLKKWIQEVMDKQYQYFTEAGHIPDFIGKTSKKRKRRANP